MSESIDPLILFAEPEQTPENTQSSKDELAESEGETTSEETQEVQAAEEAEPTETEEGDDSQSEESAESEEEAGDDSEEAEATGEDETELFLDLDGEEVSLTDVKEWRKADMSEKKFTQLRQEDAKREKRNIDTQTRLNDQSLYIVSVAEAANTFLGELKNDGLLDEQGYNDFIAKVDKLKTGVAESEQAAQVTHINTENELFIKRNKHWLDKNGDLIDDVVSQDIKKIESYLAKEGYTPIQMGEITDHRIKIALQKAVKYDEYLATRKKKVVEVRSKVKKAKVQSKPKVSPKAPKKERPEELLWN